MGTATGAGVLVEGVVVRAAADAVEGVGRVARKGLGAVSGFVSSEAAEVELVAADATDAEDEDKGIASSEARPIPTEGPTYLLPGGAPFAAAEADTAEEEEGADLANVPAAALVEETEELAGTDETTFVVASTALEPMEVAEGAGGRPESPEAVAEPE